MATLPQERVLDWPKAGVAVLHRVIAPTTTSVEGVLRGLGSTLLELLLGNGDGSEPVTDVVIYDVDESRSPPGAIVLAVASRSSDEISAVLDRVGRQRAAAVVVRSPVVLDEALREAACRSGVTLLGLTPGASWTQLAFLLSSLLRMQETHVPESDFGVPTGDLYAVANAVCSLLDAPIVLIDRNSKVLAFSARQDEADQPRIDTIIRRRVPARFTEAYQARGVFRELYRDERPVFIPPVTEELPRVAVPVMAGGEVLGSIWATVEHELSPEREQAFIDCAKLVALNMIRQSVTADVTRHLRSQRVMTLLEGAPGADAAMRALGISLPAVVWAWGLRDAEGTTSSSDAEAERQRVLDALAFHASTVHPASGVAACGNTVYVILPVLPDTTDPESDSVLKAQTFCARTRSQFSGRVGVSKVVSDLALFPAARADADRALRVLRAGHPVGAAGGISEHGVDALILELRDLAALYGHVPSGPVARLLRYDRDKGTDLVGTLRTWLDCFGDVQQAAASMRVHNNTFRYRLRRALEVGGISLGDQSGRFALMVQLRLLEPKPSLR